MSIYRVRATTSISSDGFAYLAIATDERPYVVRPGVFVPKRPTQWVAYLAGEPDQSATGDTESDAIGRLVIALAGGRDRAD